MKIYALISTIAMSAAAHAGVIITYENPTIQNTQTSFQYLGVASFDDVSRNGQAQFQYPTLNTTFQTSGTPITIQGVYSNVNVAKADHYGGAGGIGNYVRSEAPQSAAYSLKITTSEPLELNYFGAWISAIDSGNELKFFKNGVNVANINAMDILDRIGGCPSGNYCGNPTDNFLGQIPSENYVFANFYFTGGQTFDEIIFNQNYNGYSSGRFETDNHTVGYYLDVTGNAVPEASTWAMLILGFGLVGSAMRRNSRKAIIA